MKLFQFGFRNYANTFRLDSINCMFSVAFFVSACWHLMSARENVISYCMTIYITGRYSSSVDVFDRLWTLYPKGAEKLDGRCLHFLAPKVLFQQLRMKIFMISIELHARKACYLKTGLFLQPLITLAHTSRTPIISFGKFLCRFQSRTHFFAVWKNAVQRTETPFSFLSKSQS